MTIENAPEATGIASGAGHSQTKINHLHYICECKKSQGNKRFKPLFSLDKRIKLGGVWDAQI